MQKSPQAQKENSEDKVRIFLTQYCHELAGGWVAVCLAARLPQVEHAQHRLQHAALLVQADAHRLVASPVRGRIFKEISVADPDPTPDPAPGIFVSDLQDVNKKLGFFAYYLLKLHLHHFSKIKSHKEVTKQ